MDAKHTPGPWVINPKNGHEYPTFIDTVGGISASPIAKVYDDRDTHLIAAAPELLSELKQCAALLKTAADEINDAIGKAVIVHRLEVVSALIAKATGE